MGFEKLPGNKGLLYVPESTHKEKKCSCPDCFACQWCSNERCRVCRGMAAGIKSSDIVTCRSKIEQKAKDKRHTAE